MANINKALDDLIISGRRGGGGGRGGGRRSLPGGLRSDKLSGGGGGKWKHDKFSDLYGGGNKRRSVGGSVGGGGFAARKLRGGNIVKLNISSLPETVVTSDLEELFQDFNVIGVAVHYDESGAHLGTADLFVDIPSAKDIMREYANIAIDGQEIKIAVVDESGSLPGGVGARIQDRIHRVANNPISRRSLQRPLAAGRFRGGGGGGRGGRRVGGGGGGGGGKPKAEKPKLSMEELDKQLESYMGSRHPLIS